MSLDITNIFDQYVQSRPDHSNPPNSKLGNLNVGELAHGGST
jgi:hypothetical protein